MDEKLKALRNKLAILYIMPSDIITLMTTAGLKPQLISWGSSSIAIWNSIVKQAKNNNQIDALLDAALEDYDGDDTLVSLKDNSFTPPPTKASGTVDWHGKKGKTAQFEKLMGKKSALLPYTFLDKGYHCGKSIGRIHTGSQLGTGFLIQGGFILTNWHVLPDFASAAGATINFEFSSYPEDAGKRIPLDPANGFATGGKAASDWSIVKLSQTVDLDPILLANKPVKGGDRVNIIQHPEGGVKQICIHQNFVAYAGDNVVQYLADTLGGSSGSPVFDNEWDIVALHHSGGWLEDPDSKGEYFRNEGIAMKRVIDEINQSGVLTI